MRARGKRGHGSEKEEKVHITSKNQSSLPSYIAKPIAGRTSIPGHSASPDTFLQMEKIRRWGDPLWGWVERRGAGVGRVHRIERGASKRARGGMQRARGWVARRSWSSGSSGGGAGRRRRRRRAGKEEEDRREGEKPQRASGWYIADQYNCTLVLINNRRWERKKRAMQQQQRRRWWRQRTQHTNNTRYISRPGWLSAYQTAPSPPLLFFSRFFPLPRPRSHSLSLALSPRKPGPPPFFPASVERTYKPRAYLPSPPPPAPPFPDK